MKNSKLLLEVINQLDELKEREYVESDKGGYFERYSTHIEFIDKDDRDEMVNKLKEVYNYLYDDEKDDEIKIRYYEMTKMLCDFAIFYHKNKIKDVANDASEFLTDYLKEKKLL